MNWTLLVFLFGLVSLSCSVILSLEESEAGLNDYRYFYFTIPAYDGVYSKPYFTIVDYQLTRPYGALGSLYCPASTSGVAVYEDVDGDSLKEWTCQSINVLPFANEGSGEPSPPLCSSTTSSGTPTLWNNTLGAWYCAGFNHILTAARRDDDTPCATADFMEFDATLDEIRCIDPTLIPEELTATQSKRDITERVNTEDDKKWHETLVIVDATGLASRTWHNFKWTPTINYDLSSSFSIRPSPPIVFPWATEALAVTFASFRINGYSWNIQVPTSTDSFVGAVSKVRPNGSTVVVSNTLTFNSISATSGQVTFGLRTLAESAGAPGETFVASYSGRTWTAFPTSTDRHVIAITVWVSMNENLTELLQ
jgi:hypothetical protein